MSMHFYSYYMIPPQKSISIKYHILVNYMIISICIVQLILYKIWTQKYHNYLHHFSKFNIFRWKQLFASFNVVESTRTIDYKIFPHYSSNNFLNYKNDPEEEKY